MNKTKITAINDSIDELLKRREKAVSSLIKSLQSLTLRRQYEVITSWMPLDRLEECARQRKEKR